MGTRYHYDRNGNYKGKTSDEPPGNGGEWVVALVLVVIFCWMCGGC